MQHYRLLRNNSESGPYTQQDLIDLGLKAYDLIWMEGKSSSWKYPSELESLKAFAPPATEDLYVIFHTPKLVRQAVPHPAPAKSATTITQKSNERRYVSVILPSSANQSNSIQISKPRIEQAIPEIVALGIEPTSTETFPADSSIAMPVATHYKSGKRYLMAAAFLLLLATGIYFGTENRPKPVSAPDTADRLPAGLISLTSSTPAVPVAVEHNSIPPNKSLEFAAVKRFVHVSPAVFNVGFFGGIDGLVLTVKNIGKIKLSNIVIAVDYLNKDRSIDHTENLAIPGLDPQKSVSVTAPDSRKGIAIQTRIIGVNNLSQQ